MAKVKLQNYFIGAACNVTRWIQWEVWELQQAAFALRYSTGERDGRAKLGKDQGHRCILWAPSLQRANGSQAKTLRFSHQKRFTITTQGAYSYRLSGLPEVLLKNSPLVSRIRYPPHFHQKQTSCLR